MRMNIGAPRHIIINALERIAHAFESQNDLHGKEQANG
jgi:bifunctional pyridoxal-dependent enzyme with beta-cystathionase and maltose regulon repressor activities